MAALRSRWHRFRVDATTSLSVRVDSYLLISVSRTGRMPRTSSATLFWAEFCGIITEKLPENGTQTAKSRTLYLSQYERLPKAMNFCIGRASRLEKWARRIGASLVSAEVILAFRSGGSIFGSPECIA